MSTGRVQSLWFCLLDMPDCLFYQEAKEQVILNGDHLSSVISQMLYFSYSKGCYGGSPWNYTIPAVVMAETQTLFSLIFAKPSNSGFSAGDNSHPGLHPAMSADVSTRKGLDKEFHFFLSSPESVTLVPGLRGAKPWHRPLFSLSGSKLLVMYNDGVKTLIPTSRKLLTENSSSYILKTTVKAEF